MADEQLINGDYVSYANIGISVEIYEGESIRTGDIPSIKWDQKREPGEVRGAGGEVRGRTVGEPSRSGEMTMYKAAALRLKKALSAKHKNYGLVPFDLTVQWTPLYGEGELLTARLIGCRLAGVSSDNGNGPDAAVETLPLSIMRIEEDGTTI